MHTFNVRSPPRTQRTSRKNISAAALPESEAESHIAESPLCVYPAAWIGRRGKSGSPPPPPTYSPPPFFFAFSKKSSPYTRQEKFVLPLSRILSPSAQFHRRQAGWVGKRLPPTLPFSLGWPGQRHNLPPPPLPRRSCLPLVRFLQKRFSLPSSPPSLRCRRRRPSPSSFVQVPSFRLSGFRPSLPLSSLPLSLPTFASS